MERLECDPGELLDVTSHKKSLCLHADTCILQDLHLIFNLLCSDLVQAKLHGLQALLAGIVVEEFPAGIAVDHLNRLVYNLMPPSSAKHRTRPSLSTF